MGNLVTSQEKQGGSENVKPKSEKSYPFSSNVPLLYTLKTSESRRFSDVSGGIEVEFQI